MQLQYMEKGHKKEIEADLEKAVLKARRCGISDEELKNLLELILEG